MVGPDPKADLCTGSMDCNLDIKKIKTGQLGHPVGGQFSITPDGKTMKQNGGRGVRIGCKPEWQRVKGDDTKILSCGMVNGLLDGMFHFVSGIHIWSVQV